MTSRLSSLAARYEEFSLKLTRYLQKKKYVLSKNTFQFYSPSFPKKISKIFLNILDEINACNLYQQHEKTVASKNYYPTLYSRWKVTHESGSQWKRISTNSILTTSFTRFWWKTKQEEIKIPKRNKALRIKLCFISLSLAESGGERAGFVDILITSSNQDKIIRQRLRITSRAPTKVRKWS